MKKLAIRISLNLLLFLALQILVVIVGFLLGLASSNKFVHQQWILYWTFCASHVALSVWISYFATRRLEREDFISSIAIIFLWLVTAWYITK